MVRVENLTYKIPKGKVVLEDISFSVEAGEFLGILGRNGAGKTTLLDLLMGFRPVGSGIIHMLGESPSLWPETLSKKVAFLSQEIKLQKSYSILEQLRYHSFYYDSYDFEKEKDLLDYFDLDPRQKIGGLSTGQQKKVQIISNLCVKGKVMIIDEITAVLDPETRLQFFRLLEEMHREKHHAIILATNIVEDLKHRVDKILFLDKTRAIHALPGDIDKLFNLERH